MPLYRGMCRELGGGLSPSSMSSGLIGVVAGQVPAVLHPVLAPGEVGQGAVQGLVGQHELGLLMLRDAMYSGL